MSPRLALSATDPMRQMTLALGAAPAQRFDNFVPGANDQWPQVLEALRAPRAGVPLFVWGPSGSGKSHLLAAAADAVQARGGRVMACGADSPLPWTFDADLRLLLLDDAERYSDAQQHAAFTLFVEATTHAVPVLAAGRLPPVDLPVREDLRTRLGWGLVYQLVPPTDAEVRALMRREADRRGILLGDDVIDYLLTRHARNLSHLMNLLDRLDVFSLASKRAVTLPLLRQMLATEAAMPESGGAS
ncbi:MAG: DnaA regulatory inactivator Hda [Burkholderiales bacterium]